MSIIFTIVPRLPPSTCGVGDYALYLAQKLRQNFGIKTQFIVCDPNWSSQPEIDGFPILKLSAPTTSNLVRCLQEGDCSQLFVHYVGYGYARWGCPDWLLKALSTWRARSPKAQLITMFHELYALPGNKPWKHNFWNSSSQKILTQQLIRLSDHRITSSQNYAETIDHFRSDSGLPTLFFPVFSTVGEPPLIKPWADRSSQLVIFGQALTKRRAYEERLAAIQSACEQFDIQEIIDVGPATGLGLKTVGNIPVREAGKCSIEEISTIFQNSKLGFLNYNPDYLAKSTIFAAYCAYGLLPISPFRSILPTDGLTPGEHYWVIDETMARPESIVHNAQVWYRSHSLESQTQYFAKLLHTK